MQITWSAFHSLYSDAEVKAYVPRSAGVYLLWVQLKDEKWHCFYVGQADDLKRRLLEHLADSEENECIKRHVSKYVCGYKHAEIARQADRDGVEKYLYDHYKPECNQIDPGGSPIQVNLP
jgi:excinuclease UvrABC nuclease subunit